MTFSGTGRAPGPEQRGELGRFFGGEIAADLSRTADDGFADDGSAQHLSVEHDREWPPDIVAGDLTEALGADRIEPERDDRLIGHVVEPGCGLGQPVSLQHGLTLNDIGLATGRIRHPHVSAGSPLPRVAIWFRADPVERKFCRASQQRLDALRILHTGQLHKDAISAKALDRWLGHTDLVDAAADDFEALLDGSPLACDHPRGRAAHSEVARLRR